MKVLVEQINILETMTPLDFLDFRDMLRPASGFQSVQFKVLETILGLRIENRHGREYFLTQLRPDDVAQIREVEKRTPVTVLMNRWLERMPFFDHHDLWPEHNPSAFWMEYRQAYADSLGEGEKQMLAHFDNMLMDDGFLEPHRTLSTKARRAALFINLYRDYPMLQLPYRLIDSLLELDELMAIWRFRHVNMVHRMIGHRVGTGGSSGKDYLRSALDKHYIFQEYAELTSLLIDRQRVPRLTPALEKRLGYAAG
jgi:tryptophan 2,3-dioxygenase